MLIQVHFCTVVDDINDFWNINQKYKSVSGQKKNKHTKYINITLRTLGCSSGTLIHTKG